MSAGLLEKAVNHGEAQARALVLRLGSKKRFINPLQDVRRNASPGVGHGDHNILSRRQLIMLPNILIVEEGITGLNRQPTFAVHRVAGVDREIQDRIFKLEKCFIALCPTPVGAGTGMRMEVRFKAAQSSEDRYRLLVEAITDYAIYMLDRGGRVTSWNPGARRFNLVTFLEKALPFTVFAGLFLLYVRAFFIGHRNLPR